KKMDVFAEGAFGDLFQRRQIVEYPDRAPMGRQYERVITRLNLYVVNPHQGQVAFHARPVRAAIERHVGAEFGPQKQKVLIVWMLAKHPAREACGQIPFQRFPGFAVISRNENVRAQVVVAMSIKSCVDSSFGITRRNDATDIRALRNTADLTAQVLPGLRSVL